MTHLSVEDVEHIAQLVKNAPEWRAETDAKIIELAQRHHEQQRKERPT